MAIFSCAPGWIRTNEGIKPRDLQSRVLDHSTTDAFEHFHSIAEISKKERVDDVSPHTPVRHPVPGHGIHGYKQRT